MKNYAVIFLIALVSYLASCKKDENSANFKNITGTIWRSDSLLVNGVNAGGTGGLLQNFSGDVIFNADGTGNFGSYSGDWRFALNETQLVITSPALPLPLTAQIKELTPTSLKITTAFPDPSNPANFLSVRMTFKPK
jgi:hypothetical protein